ncbi:MAG: NAD(P)H-binding protein [Ideonella sp.]|nr:NAD(P)H-binding protein [Ideonella sp.]
MVKGLKMAAVMVLGANGRLGHAAVQAFAAAGWQVWAQARQAPRQPLPKGVTSVQADALDLPALRAAAPRLDLIVNALNPHYTQWDALVPPLTSAVIQLAEATGGTIMLPGNVYNFGNQLPPVLTEQTPFADTNPKAGQRIRLEAALADAARRGVRSIVVRAGDFLGDSGTWLDLGLGRALKAGKVTHLAPEDVPHAWAYLPDLARVFVAVAERRAQLPAHAVLHYAGLTLTGAELHRLIEGAMGKPLQRASFPWWLMKLIAPVAAMPRALLEMRHLWLRPHRLDEARLVQLIGSVPHTPAEQVLRDSLAQLPGVTVPGTPVRSATRSAA